MWVARAPAGQEEAACCPTVRRWVERRFADQRHWGERERGGHFAAAGQPGPDVDEVRATFRAVRGAPGPATR